MSESKVSIQNLGKRYKIGSKHKFRYKTMTHNITSLFRNNMRRMSALFNSGSDAKEMHTQDNTIWSLKDVSFDVGEGEIVGIIGRNGAGKSTLLKIISGITDPTEGKIEIYGRIGSLLEVGTGFHPELTGRDNIYLNGAILGMKKAEIENKFDEIVAFSEVENFIDTEVKFYSSGMRVRLGFSVAAHLEPEILLLDEVLAVGDAAFQKKCLGKLNNVAHTKGRTIIFVSHDMTAVQSLCQKTALIENGRLLTFGSTEKVIEQYLQSMDTTTAVDLDQRKDRSGDLSVLATFINIENIDSSKTIRTNSRLKITIGYRSSVPVRFCRIELTIRDFKSGTAILFLDTEASGGLPEVLPPEGTIVCVTEKTLLTPGTCIVDIEISKGKLLADSINHAGYFDVRAEDIYGSGKAPSRNQAIYSIENDWSVEPLEPE